ncbi:glycosyl transferase [Gloeophyllum trabeum ATCC 11539]|uniref:Glycosyl transferase n=1 Tax=Gloeophyllum trabeum (strain ATCC 11539 / FP-39264 / Madison 617) TaxID=670483 RepID=S7RNR4_GLOTA|nr:glycosyl transferase [Gloeophyllum trabeum ATCC 11539]EPQ56155.1 glycosyl transferase [Gloeophyllum trabeum ATCC 11539]
MHIRQRFLFILLLVLLLVLLGFSLKNNLRVRNFLSYSTRPLWDTPIGPREILPHYYAEGIAFDEHLCALHGWQTRARPAEVWDAILVSTELDLLEVRMHELDPVVSKFFVVESDLTFTGLPKRLAFQEDRERFAQFEGKIVYSTFHGRQLDPFESPFVNEIEQRRHMDALLREQAKPDGPLLVIYSDVDEIPSAHTIKLLQHCSAPSPLHLQMSEYLYSFEWPAGKVSWRAQVHLWNKEGGFGYGHSQVADHMLADSGWHCTFCFRYIDEFVTKMKGYSHADRVTDKSLLEPDRIQEVVCSGDDIFGMLPEAYRYKDLFDLLNKDPSPSALHVPLHILQNSDKFRFLLPGGCVREK